MRISDWSSDVCSSDLAIGIDAVVLSTQHDPSVKLKTLREGVMEEILKPVLPAKWIDKKTKFHINPTGNFVIGGPVGDCGLTGRKITELGRASGRERVGQYV